MASRFQNLFRNHGDKFLDALLVHLERLVIDKEEHNQRCAAEIMAAVIRGSKHWPYAKVERLWGALEPLVRLALANMTVETVSDWGVCFATAAENRDPNRQHWLYELLMERPLQGESSFVECGKMYTLQGALNQQVWRVSQLMHRLVAYLAPYLTHPFQNVRNRVSSVLVNAFETDVVFPAGGPTNSLRIGDFVRGVVPRLQVLHDVKDDASGVDCAADRLNNIHLNETDRETAIRLFKTGEPPSEDKSLQHLLFESIVSVCKWIIGSITRTNFGSVPAFYELFPLACQLQSYEADEELTSVCSAMLALLAQAMTLARDVPVALGSVSAVSDSRSWSARAACAEFLQVFVFHNMATVASDLRWVHQVSRARSPALARVPPRTRFSVVDQGRGSEAAGGREARGASSSQSGPRRSLTLPVLTVFSGVIGECH